MLRPAKPTRVRFWTVLDVRDARWNRRSRSLVVVPARRADSSARDTCPAISASPTTSDSSPLETAKRWPAISVPERSVSAARSASGSTPAAAEACCTRASATAEPAASSTSR